MITWDNDDKYSGNCDGSLVKFGLKMAELKYGEGNELKDKLHDSRLFNKEDGGAGAKGEAEQFFGS